MNNKKPVLLSKKDKKLLKKKAKKIDKLYQDRFSKGRLKKLSFFGCIGKVLAFLGLLVTFSAIFYLVQMGVQNCFDKADSSILIGASWTVLGVSATLFVGVCFAIVFSLGSTNEYFNRTESTLFFRVSFLGFLDNGLIATYSVVYCLVALVLAFLNQHLIAIIESLISGFFSFFLAIKVILYIRKNRYERFSYCLTHSQHFSKISKKDIILDFLTMLDVTDRKGKIKKKQLDDLMDKRIYSIYKYIWELSKKIQKDENIVFEQNNLEDFYVWFSKRVKTPIQLFSLIIGVETYLECISKADASLRKDMSKTRDNIHLVLASILHNEATHFAGLPIRIDDFPVFSTSTKGFSELITEKINKLLLSQNVFIGMYKQFISFIETDKAFDGLDAIDLSDGKRIVDELDINLNQNLDSISNYLDEEDKAIEKLFNSIEMLKEGKKHK